MDSKKEAAPEGAAPYPPQSSDQVPQALYAAPEMYCTAPSRRLA